ncbi:hypothetical protein [Fibrobacter sp. UWEL]|uniref:hypothetical protein n=1 Tax=Fibrobacter sp. UWEL TaxID=1896209 RepID=UPI0009107C42|nr:hypothetical protein [Fibrobacter sp. UWEL]SHL47990.1 hypothetical protein SAMN05720468_13212 [Fibrobacter sp. UWEL]
MNLKFMLFSLPLALLCACGNDTTVAKYIVTDQKIVLEEWPDEAYIASLDSVLAAEPLKKQKAVTTNITMNAHQAPIFKLPPQVTGKKEAIKSASQKKLDGASYKTPHENKASIKTKSDNSAEAFADRFTNGLAKLQSDPNNAGLYKMASAGDGDDVMKLLRRTYGSAVLTLPRFFIMSQLKSVNPGLNLESLNAGDKVKLPKI